MACEAVQKEALHPAKSAAEAVGAGQQHDKTERNPGEQEAERAGIVDEPEAEPVRRARRRQRRPARRTSGRSAISETRSASTKTPSVAPTSSAR
jgi:hypothetical protein